MVASAPFHKHLGLVLDEKLTFGYHLSEKISKANKGIGLIKRLYFHLPRKSLLSIYKSFIRPHLDYGDVIYDQPHNDTFCRMIESVQYNAALVITGTIKGSSRGTVDLFIFLILFLVMLLVICVHCCLVNNDLMIR